MADKKITELTQLGVAEYADLLVVVDVSAYETKNITLSNLMGSPGPIGDNNADTGKFTTLQLLHGVTINEISSDITLSGNSNSVIPTENAVKTYVDNSVTSIVTDHNDLNNLQGGDSTAHEYYHLTNERYTFLSNLTNNHNDLNNLQGGDSTAHEYYHLKKDIYNNLFSLSSSLCGIGNSNTNINLNTTNHTITGIINNILELLITSNGLRLKSGVSVNRISDDENFLNNSPSSLVTERAIKAYIDSNSGGNDETSNIVVLRVSSDSTAVANNILLVNTSANDVNIKMYDSLNGKIIIKKISNDSNNVIITSTNTIDGFNQYIINTPKQSYNFLVDSGEFFVI
jgi:hypothetical protein